MYFIHETHLLCSLFICEVVICYKNCSCDHRSYLKQKMINILTPSLLR